MPTGLKARLAAGEIIVGTFLKTPSPILVEVLSMTALDCLCLDAEHAPFDRVAIDGCIMAARGSDSTWCSSACLRPHPNKF